MEGIMSIPRVFKYTRHCYRNGVLTHSMPDTITSTQVGEQMAGYESTMAFLSLLNRWNLMSVNQYNISHGRLYIYTAEVDWRNVERGM